MSYLICSEPETRALEHCLCGSKALLTGQSVESLILHIEFLNDGIGERTSSGYSWKLETAMKEVFEKVAVWQTSDEHERILPEHGNHARKLLIMM